MCHYQNTIICHLLREATVVSLTIIFLNICCCCFYSLYLNPTFLYKEQKTDRTDFKGFYIHWTNHYHNMLADNSTYCVWSWCKLHYVCFHLYLLCLDRLVPNFGSCNRMLIVSVSCWNQRWLFKLSLSFSSRCMRSCQVQDKSSRVGTAISITHSIDTASFLFLNKTPGVKHNNRLLFKKRQATRRTPSRAFAHSCHGK